MIADRLRAAVLQAAISGKLTDQRPEDGTAKELLEQIKAERNELVESKKLKKKKPLPPVTDEDRPFTIPSNWEWVRLGDYAHDRGQQTPQVPFTYIDISAIDNRKQTLDRANLAVLSPEAAPSRARRTALPGDVIYSTVRPYLHNACILPGELQPEPIVSTGLAVLTSGRMVANRLLLITMLSPYFDELANHTDNSRGVAYPAINDTQLRKLPIPVPPPMEQERIVAKLDEVLPLIDQLAELEREREYLDREFAKAIERAILQAAISGKLTKQLPEDGTAEELLEQIAAERDELVRAKKLKKQKPLPPADKADELFDLPSSWRWAQIGSVMDLLNGRAYKQPELKTSGKWPVLRVGNLFTNESWYYSDLELEEDKYCEAGDLLYAWSASFGPHVWSGAKSIFHYHIWKVRYFSMNRDYLNFVLQWDVNRIRTATTGSTMVHVSMTNMRPRTVPVAPVPEQERIVAKLDRALPLARAIGELVS